MLEALGPGLLTPSIEMRGPVSATARPPFGASGMVPERDDERFDRAALDARTVGVPAGDPKAILAASPDELQKTHDSTQQEIKANADRIAALQDKLDKMPRKSAHAGEDGAALNNDDFTSLQKKSWI